MQVLVDVGNTATKIKRYDQGKLFELDYDAVSESINEITKVIVTQVTNDSKLEQILNRLPNNKVIYPQVNNNAFGIQCGYPKSSNLGIDRWLAVLGAEKIYPNCNIIVVDSGTATTVDFLSSNKNHLGGWIIPGLELMESSIASKAPLVFSDSGEYSDTVGTDTPAALKNGCLQAHIGLIQQAVSTFYTKKLLLTGGGAKHLVPYFADAEVIEDLVFLGMARYL